MQPVKFIAWNGTDIVSWDDIKGFTVPLLIQTGHKLMQFIGLLDCDGNEIYSGFILRDKEGNQFEVVYEDAQWWAINKDMSIRRGLEAMTVRANKFKVCGSVYKNPDMLYYVTSKTELTAKGNA